MWLHKRELANPKIRQQGTHTEWFPFQRRGPYPNRPFSYLDSGVWIELTYAVFSGSFKSCFLKKSRKIDGEVIPWFQTFMSIHFLSGRNGVRIYQVPIIRDPWTSLFACLFLVLFFWEDNLVCSFCIRAASWACCSSFIRSYTYLYVSATCIFQAHMKQYRWFPESCIYTTIRDVWLWVRHFFTGWCGASASIFHWTWWLSMRQH